MAKFLRYFWKYDGPDEWVFNYARRWAIIRLTLVLFGSCIGFLLAFVWTGDDLYGKIMITLWLAFLGALAALGRLT